MARQGDGVEPRGQSIRIGFSWAGERCRETLDLRPTPGNLKYATRLVATIKQRIEAGTFDYAEFFPESKRVQEQPQAHTFGGLCDTWLKTKGRLADKTLNQYRNALGVWKRLLGESTPIRGITHGQLAACIGGHAWASPKLLNNYMIVLRGVFKLAVRELGLSDNPMEGIENSKAQKPGPDPLSVQEMASVLHDMRERYDVRVWAYFAFAFATGARPEETISLRWSDVDWANHTIRIERAKTNGKIKPIKTYSMRDVELVDLAVEAITEMKPWTMPANAEIFQNPVTNRPWHDERSQRDHYWKPTLQRTGVRYRKPYNTRHTYATASLMSDANPTYIARQMGHRTAKMLFDVYGKWIERADRGRERGKVNSAFSLGSSDSVRAATS